MATLREYLEKCALPRPALDRFFDPSAPTWAKPDPELGYHPSPAIVPEGIDASRCIYTYEPAPAPAPGSGPRTAPGGASGGGGGGARRIVNHRGHPCRVNTYGNSFTHCCQVSDGETWQEILAAHLGEPLRNWGIGGQGMYQAYRRMRRVESGPEGAQYVVLNIYEADHRRNVMAAFWLHIPWFHAQAQDGLMFHGTPWAHLRFDIQSSRWVERENLFTTPESLYALCDPRTMYETFRDDPAVKLEVLGAGGDVGDTADLRRLSEALGVPWDATDPESTKRSAGDLFQAYGLRATIFVVDRVREFLAQRGKKLMVLLSYGAWTVGQIPTRPPRRDQLLLDHLAASGVPFVDALAKHRTDMQAFSLSPEDYVKRYYYGHYTPAGNQFFAFAIKDALVAWLEPKPPAYREGFTSTAEWVQKFARAGA